MVFRNEMTSKFHSIKQHRCFVIKFTRTVLHNAIWAFGVSKIS
ncbi:hypothetical protein BN13_2090003 [Nostocoides jenkinsii Ben 74]|uniref:Uncharacterized protein n=1 Tax=Nostocoides jenkinsii Ben 74 TaxID=1193518 RepID=A0A077MD35_9MICO|nr:hypothetical protein BN13_2090003 [Tetrasphaera jenkinsii Ben 74]